MIISFGSRRSMVRLDGSAPSSMALVWFWRHQVYPSVGTDMVMESITRMRLPGFAPRPRRSKRKRVRTVCESGELPPEPELAVRFFRLPVCRERSRRTGRRICSRSADDRSIGVATDAALVAAGRKNSGTSKSDMRAALDSAVGIEARSACPVQERRGRVLQST